MVLRDYNCNCCYNCILFYNIDVQILSASISEEELPIFSTDLWKNTIVFLCPNLPMKLVLLCQWVSVTACVQQSKGYSVRTRSALASRNGLFYPLNRCHRGPSALIQTDIGSLALVASLQPVQFTPALSHASQRAHLSNSPSPPLPNTLTVWTTRTKERRRVWVWLELKFTFVTIYLFVHILKDIS